MTNTPATGSEMMILYQTEDGRTRIQCRFDDQTVWLSQKLMADLFQIGMGTINHHLKAIYAENELGPEATIRRYRIVQSEGNRQVTREVEHYVAEGVMLRAFGFTLGHARLPSCLAGFVDGNS